MNQSKIDSILEASTNILIGRCRSFISDRMVSINRERIHIGR